MSQAAVYEVESDRVPEVYRDFFNNADWTLHKFVVGGSWSFFIVACVAHLFVWLWRPW
jgi:Antenna complex alpha/beta subunit